MNESTNQSSVSRTTHLPLITKTFYPDINSKSDSCRDTPLGDWQSTMAASSISRQPENLFNTNIILILPQLKDITNFVPSYQRIIWINTVETYLGSVLFLANNDNPKYIYQALCPFCVCVSKSSK